MKKNGIFQGIVLIGIGIYFLTPHLSFTILNEFHNWQSLLMLIGMAFLFHAYSAKEYSYILPGIILLGFGIYFDHAKMFSFLPRGFSSMVLIIAIGLFLQYLKTKAGLIQGLILFAVSLLFYFYQQFINWISHLAVGTSHLLNYWPVLLILIGCYFIFIKKK